MYTAAPPPPLAPAGPRPGRGPMVVAGVLTGLFTVAAAALGVLRWARPVWAPSSGWMIERVPASLAVLVAATAVVGVVIAFALTARATRLRAGQPVTWLWAALLLVTAGALVWNALYAAALSTIQFGALIPIFDWLFTFAPAVLTGWLFIRRGRRERWTAALSTGVVTVPLLALSFALLGHKEPVVAGILGTLSITAVLGLVPLVGGVAVAVAIGGRDQPG